MKFAVYDLNKDSLEVTVFDKDLFSPNGKTIALINCPWSMAAFWRLLYSLVIEKEPRFPLI
jgi:hypothetical protein